VVVNEKTTNTKNYGHAFLIHDDALKILSTLPSEKELHLPVVKTNKFLLYSFDGIPLKKTKIQHWNCLKRSDLLTFLYSFMPADCIKTGRAFKNSFMKTEKQLQLNLKTVILNMEIYLLVLMAATLLLELNCSAPQNLQKPK